MVEGGLSRRVKNISYFVSKLKMVKQTILEWNKWNFKNIFEKKERIEEELDTLNEEVINVGMD